MTNRYFIKLFSRSIRISFCETQAFGCSQENPKAFKIQCILYQTCKFSNPKYLHACGLFFSHTVGHCQSEIVLSL